MSDYTPHPDDVAAGGEAWRVLLSSYGPHDFPRTEETVRVILAAVGPAIEARALRQACRCESAFCDEFCAACEVVFDTGECLLGKVSS